MLLPPSYELKWKSLAGDSGHLIMTFTNCYDDQTRAEAYASLEFANTYYLAYRDLPNVLTEHVRGRRALDFGCGTGRSTRFLHQLGFEVTGLDASSQMLAKARDADAAGDYRLLAAGDFSQLDCGSYDLVLSAFTFEQHRRTRHENPAVGLRRPRN
jgi:2-polyprenyl-3-methyl-5-hydroxy-6-metoxy-1,4-benzoquinol methylase